MCKGGGRHSWAVPSFCEDTRSAPLKRRARVAMADDFLPGGMVFDCRGSLLLR